jgi:hypothetical protein
LSQPVINLARGVPPAKVLQVEELARCGEAAWWGFHCAKMASISPFWNRRSNATQEFELASAQPKRDSLEQLQVKVVIEGKQAVFTCRLPIGPRVSRSHGTQTP